MLDILGWCCVGALSLVGVTASSLFIPSKSKDSTVRSKDNHIASYKELKSLMGNDGFVLSEHIQYSLKSSTEHVLVLGPTSSGKTSKIIKYNIARLNNCSIVCTDPSRDIERDVQRDGFDKLVFDPLNPSKSIGFNPLQNCKTTTEVRDVMEILLINGLKSANSEAHSDFQKWAKLSIPLVNVYAIYNYKYNKYGFGDMMHRILTAPILQTKEQMVPQEVGGVKQMVRARVLVKSSLEFEIRESGDAELISEFEGFLQSIGSPECLANIRLTLSSGLSLFKDSVVRELCNKPVVDYMRLRHYRSILYIQIPERYAEFYYPITSVMIKQIMDVTMEHPDGLPLMFVLDELCNIGLVPRFDKVLSTVRRYNIGVMGCTQSISQLEDLYGAIRTKTILENFVTSVALGGLSDSADYFSKLLGHTIEDVDGCEKEKLLMQPSEVRMLNKSKALIIYGNRRGVVDSLLTHYPKS